MIRRLTRVASARVAAARVAAVVGVVTAVIGVSWGTAFAVWTASSTNASGRAAALAMPAGNAVTAPATSSGSVTVTFPVAVLAGADLVDYTVRRYPAAGGAGTVIPCAQSIANRVVSCTYTETAAGSYQFTNAPGKANWVGAESAKSATTVVTLTTTRTFTVAVPAGNRTAGQAFNVTLTAMTNGVVDTAYTGSHSIKFTGPNTAPNGQAPTDTVNVAFNAGVGTAGVTLYKAESATLTATEQSPARSGSASVTVNAGAQSQLGFTVACPTALGSWTSGVEILDAWKNPTAHGGSATTINLSAGANGSVSPASLTVAAGANPARTSGTFTYTPAPNKKATTVTASVSANALTQAACALPAG